MISHDTRKRALHTLHETFYKAVRGKSLTLKPVTNLVDEIIDEILQTKKSVISLVQLRRHDDSVFTHSVNVAALSVFLGKFIGLSKSELRSVAMGGDCA